MKYYLLYHILVLGAVLLCIGCKSRKSLTIHLDSAAITSHNRSAFIEEHHIDSSRVNIIKTITVYDSSGVKVVVIPSTGKSITIDREGNFIGEASKVEITSKKHISTNHSESVNEQKGLVTHTLADSTNSMRREVNITQKIKAIDAKPDYTWIWWVAVLFVIVLVLYRLYKKYSFLNLLLRR